MKTRTKAQVTDNEKTCIYESVKLILNNQQNSASFRHFFKWSQKSFEFDKLGYFMVELGGSRYLEECLSRRQSIDQVQRASIRLGNRQASTFQEVEIRKRLVKQ